MISNMYGGIDRLYGDISADGADAILDLVDDICEVMEAIEESDKRERAFCSVKSNW